MQSRFALSILLLGALARTARAEAALPLDTGQYSDLMKLLDPEFVNAAARTVGAAADHRPYDPASNPADRAGLELGIELTLVKLPESFAAALASAGVSNPSSTPAALPMPKIQFRKTLGRKAAIGLSGIYFRGYRIVGGDFKVVLKNAEIEEETFSSAIRLCYSDAKLGFVSTRTLSPQLLFSKPLDFAEPYFGLGAQFIVGSVSVSQAIAGQTYSFSKNGRATQFLAFMGLQLRPAVGFQFAVEGAYNTGGTPTLGVRLGLSF